MKIRIDKKYFILTYPGSFGTSSATPFEDCDCCGSKGDVDSMVIFVVVEVVNA